MIGNGDDPANFLETNNRVRCSAMVRILPLTGAPDLDAAGRL
jgi:hypothetical protein